MIDITSFALGRASAEGGGGSSVTVESLSVTQNGTTTAPSGKAYSPVTVNVPNSYAAGDEGKVVSNGSLVAQTAHAKVTQNGTIDTTLNNSVEIDVSGGGGGSSYTLLASEDFVVSTTSSSSTQVGHIELPASAFTSGSIIYIKIRDKAGARAGYYLGSDIFGFNTTVANGNTNNFSHFVGMQLQYTSEGKYQDIYNTQGYEYTSYGIFPTVLRTLNGIFGVTINSKYSSSATTATGTIDGTFNVQVYLLDYAPNQGNPFDYSYPANN